ncbi:hypothetical protein ACQKI4_23505 [Paenibacillus glucanolyticus]|uniref:hypothetical protein n=1 Tax=Paenibacillus glucanolyticus TaxID=59843 RepID=UPI003D092BF4
MAVNVPPNDEPSTRRRSMSACRRWAWTMEPGNRRSTMTAQRAKPAPTIAPSSSGIVGDVTMASRSKGRDGLFISVQSRRTPATAEIPPAIDSIEYRPATLICPN